MIYLVRGPRHSTSNSNSSFSHKIIYSVSFTLRTFLNYFFNFRVMILQTIVSFAGADYPAQEQTSIISAYGGICVYRYLFWHLEGCVCRLQVAGCRLRDVLTIEKPRCTHFETLVIEVCSVVVGPKPVGDLEFRW